MAEDNSTPPIPSIRPPRSRDGRGHTPRGTPSALHQPSIRPPRSRDGRGGAACSACGCAWPFNSAAPFPGRKSRSRGASFASSIVPSIRPPRSRGRKRRLTCTCSRTALDLQFGRPVPGTEEARRPASQRHGLFGLQFGRPVPGRKRWRAHSMLTRPTAFTPAAPFPWDGRGNFSRSSCAHGETPSIRPPCSRDGRVGEGPDGPPTQFMTLQSGCPVPGTEEKISRTHDSRLCPAFNSAAPFLGRKSEMIRARINHQRPFTPAAPFPGRKSRARG